MAGRGYFSDPDWEWHGAAELTGEVLLTTWQQAVRRSRAMLEEQLGDLDQLARHTPFDPPPSLRRILADLVEEYARHVSHANLLREAVDGAIGADPPTDLPGYPR